MAMHTFTLCLLVVRKLKTVSSLPRTSFPLKYEGHPGSKERLCIQSVHLFCCSRSRVSGVQSDVENFLLQLYVGSRHVLSAEIAVAIAVPIDNPDECEVRGIIRLLQADKILVYLAEEVFCCTSSYCPADRILAA